MKNKSLIVFVTLLTLNSVFCQVDSLSLHAEQNFRVFIDSILQKEVKTSSYTLSNFSAVKEKRTYPLQISSLVYPDFYGDKDEYYAAFLYREKYNDELNYADLDRKILKKYTKLKNVILKSIGRGQHYTKKELKLINYLQQRMESSPPPLTGYFQTARIDYELDGKSTYSWFEIHYDVLLRVESFGRK